MHGGGDVGQDARLRRNTVGCDDVGQQMVEPDHLLQIVGGGIDADHRVAATIEQAVEQTGGDAFYLVGRMIRLQPIGQAPRQSQRVAKARDDADFVRHQNHVLNAHDFGYRGCHLRRQTGRQCCQCRCIGFISEQPIAKIADGQLCNRRKGGGVMRIDDEAGDIVVGVIDNGLIEEGFQRQFRQRHLRSNTLLRVCSGDAGQTVARARRRGFGEQGLEVGKAIAAATDMVRVFRHADFQSRCRGRLIPAVARGGGGLSYKLVLFAYHGSITKLCQPTFISGGPSSAR